MDFLEILKNSSNNNNDKPKDFKQKDVKPKDFKPKDFKQKDVKDFKDDNDNDNQKNDVNTISTYKNIKTGDFIKIIYQKNSNLNTYKGYIGEIKEYRKEQDTALIFLHAISAFQLIKFPITHFIKLN